MAKLHQGLQRKSIGRVELSQIMPVQAFPYHQLIKSIREWEVQLPTIQYRFAYKTANELEHLRYIPFAFAARP